MWNLLTSNLSDNRNVFQVSGLNLFVTKKKVNSTLITVDPQSQYSQNVKPSFERPVDLYTPVPILSKIYVLNNLVSVLGFKEVFNINLLEDDSFYRDYIEDSTYILSSLTVLPISGFKTLNYEDFTEVNYFYTYNFDSNQFFSIESINVEGLIYKPNQFSFNGTTLVVEADACCGPQEGNTFNLSITYSAEEAKEIHNVYIFDFTDQDVDFIDALSSNNQTFQFSSEVVAGSLLYNRVKKLAICIKD